MSGIVGSRQITRPMNVAHNAWRNAIVISLGVNLYILCSNTSSAEASHQRLVEFVFVERAEMSSELTLGRWSQNSSI